MDFCKKNGHSIFVNVSGIYPNTWLECSRCNKELKTCDLRNGGAFIAISENSIKVFDGKMISPHCEGCVSNEKYITDLDKEGVDLSDTVYL